MALTPLRPLLKDRRVVLASASPRRREILGLTGLAFDVIPSRFEESRRSAASPCAGAYALDTAAGKALEVAGRVCQAVDGLILEKPADRQDAYRMLCRLSGKEHSVFTGVAVVACSGSDPKPEVQGFLEETRVTFSPLSEELIWEYIDSGEPMDKAGAYGIQALGGMLVERVDGDFLNVVGFPLNRFCRELGKILTGNSRPRTGNSEAQTGESLSQVNKTSPTWNSSGVPLSGLSAAPAVSQNPPVSN
ncbi:probable bifunctional dTTP/UTP pyrophosphatase/methyltransferase protein [Acomys russatus]|uniref:probable bifunctional dTTP/UTP pyrophosphatase/methyltransferase protein n=1 Tax=Acomys russatus TaxID=60746 RepID=UPI0021E31916|nr:probable bifunctional dTTP/UTP pyrophosphatase/methyltransferase protein [Acomys russatus]